MKVRNFHLYNKTVIVLTIQTPLKSAIIGPPAKRHFNAIEIGFRWRADDGPTLNPGLVASGFSGDPDQYCYETIYLCDFSGWGGGYGPPLYVYNVYSVFYIPFVSV